MWAKDQQRGRARLPSCQSSTSPLTGGGPGWLRAKSPTYWASGGTNLAGVATAECRRRRRRQEPLGRANSRNWPYTEGRRPPPRPSSRASRPRRRPPSPPRLPHRFVRSISVARQHQYSMREWPALVGPVERASACAPSVRGAIRHLRTGLRPLRDVVRPTFAPPAHLPSEVPFAHLRHAYASVRHVVQLAFAPCVPPSEMSFAHLHPTGGLPAPSRPSSLTTLHRANLKNWPHSWAAHSLPRTPFHPRPPR